MYANTENVNDVVALYERATALSPHDAQLWEDLGSGYDWAGRTAESLSAFQYARDLFPHSPEINWRLANFCVRTGRTSEGLSALRKVLETDSSSARRVFALATNATSNGQTVLEMLPLQASIAFDYINFAIERGDIVRAEQAWGQILQTNTPFEIQEAMPYLDALVQHRELTQLEGAWSSLRERFPKEMAGANPSSNLITNGAFELDILNGGLDWHVIQTEGALVSLDTGGALDGGRSLRITFDGSRNLDYGHVFQYVFVRPNTKYGFSGHMRTEGIGTDSGPKFQICDAYHPGDLFATTENFLGTRGWSEENADFTTLGDTHLLLVKVARSVSVKFDNKIAGTVWVGGVSLRSEE
jgi:Tetratricopeptide repeat